MNGRVLWVGGHGALLFLVIAGITIVSGYWAIFLALGPAAYLLVLDAHSSDNAPTMVAISYVVALIVGWLAYTAIAQGIVPTAVEPMSEPGLRVVGSALVTFAITTGIYYRLNTHQPMAYVAAFTAAIGALPTIQSLVVASVTVLLMAGVQAVRRHYGPKFSDSSRSIDEQSFEV